MERWRRVWNGGGEFGNLAQSPNRRRRVSNGGADLSSVAQSLECRRRVSVTVPRLILLKNFDIGQYKEFLATDECWIAFATYELCYVSPSKKMHRMELLNGCLGLEY